MGMLRELRRRLAAQGRHAEASDARNGNPGYTRRMTRGPQSAVAQLRHLRPGVWGAELRAMLTLAWPLVLTNLTQQAMALTDALIVGRLGTEALAAATLGANLFYAAMAPSFGLALAAAALAAQARGAGRAGDPAWREQMRASVRHAAWGCVALTVPAWLALWHTEGLLLALGQTPAVAGLAGDYVRAFMWGLLPFAWFVVLRGFLAALERPGPALVAAGFGVAGNAALAWGLTHGAFGWAGFGIAGAGAASSLAILLMFSGLAIYVVRHRALRPFALQRGFLAPAWRGVREVLALGLPISATMLLEIGVFSAAALAIGWFGAVAVAAHAMAILTASTTFMVPLGLSQAATARVGLAAGAGDTAGAARAGWMAIGLGAAFMAMMAVLLVLAARPIASLFVAGDDPLAPAAIALGATLLVVAGIFQLADGIQSVAAGALRGLKDTRVPMLIAALGYWGLGLPIGVALGWPLGLGPLGVWVGLAAGLGIVSGLMLWRWRRLGGGLPRAA